MGDSSLRLTDFANSATISCGIGVLLILASFLPLASVAARANWTEEDSNLYDQVASEYKKSAYREAGELGLTDEELAARQAKLKSTYETMSRKLERARRRGDDWSQGLRWAGLVMTAVGIVLHLAGQNRAT